MMTNEELIRHLLTMPMNAVVVFSQFSELTGMDQSKIECDDVIDQGGQVYLRLQTNVNFIDPENKPKVVKAILFPGN